MQIGSVIRCGRDKKNPFLAISRETLVNSGLSAVAMTLLLFLLSHQDSWKFYKAQIKSTFLQRFKNTSKRAFERAFGELKARGYLYIKRLSGRGFNYEWRVFESPRLNSEKIKPKIRIVADIATTKIVDNPQVSGHLQETDSNAISSKSPAKLKLVEQDKQEKCTSQAEFISKGKSLLGSYQQCYRNLIGSKIAPLAASRKARDSFTASELKIIDLMNVPGYLERLGVSIENRDEKVVKARVNRVDKNYIGTKLLELQGQNKIQGLARDKPMAILVDEVLHHAKHFVPAKPHSIQERLQLNINIALKMLKQGKWDTPKDFNGGRL